MAGSSLLTNLQRPRESKWLWPLVAAGSLLVHGLVLLLVRSLTLEVIEQRPTTAAPLPIQLVTLSPEADLAVASPSEAAPSAPGGSDASADAAPSSPSPVGNEVPDQDALNPSISNPPESKRPAIRPRPATGSNPGAGATAVPSPEPVPAPQPAPSNMSRAPSVAPSPQPTPSPSLRAEVQPPVEPGLSSPPVLRPQPPAARPAPPVISPPRATVPPSQPSPSQPPSSAVEPPSPAVSPAPPVSPPVVESPPLVERPPARPPTATQPAPALENPVPPTGAAPEGTPGTGEGAAPATPEVQAQGGQLATRIRPNPRGRDIPDVAPRLQGSSTISVQPLPPGCAVENLSALMATATSSTVQLQILVEADGRISAAYPVPGQGSGNGAVDSLVACLVQNRLSLIPASAGGAPIKTDAFILETQINF